MRDSIRLEIKKIIDLMIFNQTDTMKNFILSDETDSSLDESFTIDIEIKSVKRRRRKFRMIKCKKTMIKINKKSNEKNKLKFETIMNSKTKINLINNIFVKQFELESFNMSNCETMTIDNHFFKIYDVYFVQFEMQNENDVNRFFNDNFIKTNLIWNMTLNLSWMQLSDAKINWNIDKIESWLLTVKSILFIVNRIEKIESKELVNVVVDDKKQSFVMFVRVLRDEKTNMNNVHIERRAQIDSTLAKMKNKSDIKIIIFEVLKKFADLADENKAYELFDHESDDHVIDLKSDKKSLYDFIYSLSKNELKILRAYLDKHLKNDFIKFFIFSAGAPILFVKKKNEILRLCVNYRDLNLLTIKNRYSLSLIDESLNRLSKARIYTSLDMITTYNRLRIKKNDEWKTTFKTRYEHFEYIVLFFDLTNAFATFQSFVNKILTERLDFTVIIYLNDIVIYFMNEEQHIENVKWVLDRLREHKLFINMKKCKFFKDSIDFLDFVVSSKRVQMQKNKIDVIQKWSISRNVSEILKFLELCNFYRRFIKSFSKLTLSLISMLKKSAELHKKKIKRKRSSSKNRSKNHNKERLSNDFLIFEIYEAFKRLRNAFLKTFILQHFDSAKLIRVKIDVSNKAINEILCQSDDQNHWHSVIYLFKKMISTKCNYEIHDKKFLIIIFAFKQWRHYFERARKQIFVLTNHRNLNRFMITTKLSFRQIRWAQKLSRYNFVIDYRSDNKNSADDLSRRSDHMITIEKKIENNRQILTRLRQSLQSISNEFQICVSEIRATMLEFNNEENRFASDLSDFQKCASDVIIDEWKILVLSSATISQSINEMSAKKHIHEHDVAYDDKITDNLVELIRSLLDQNSCAIQVRQKLTTSDMSHSHWQNEKKILWHDDCLYVSSNLRKDVIKTNHDNLFADHFEVKRTLELIRRKYYWFNQKRNNLEKNVEHDSSMRAQIKKHCETCAICKKSKTSRHKSYEKLSSLSISKFKWVDFTMNFVIDLPESKTWNEATYDAILVVINRLIKMTHYISVTKTMIAKNLVEILIRKIIKLHDLSSSITTNKNSIFIVKYHDALCYALKIKLKLFTTYHSQTDDQTKRQNSIMKQYLRAFVNFEQNDWIELLSMTEFAYNNSKHTFTQMSSFETMQKYTLRMFFENFANFKTKFKSAKKHAEKLIELMKILKVNLAYAQKQQTKYKNAKIKLMNFDVDSYVNVNVKNIRIKRNKKLKWKFFESFKILNTIKNQTYRINIFKRWRIHNVFHVSLLEKIISKREKKASLKSTYQSNDIDIEKDEKLINEKYWIEIILDSKIFKEEQISNKSYSEPELYYLVQWKNYEKRIWEFVSVIKHLKDMFKKFHMKNSKKNDVSKFTNRRRVRRQINVVFTMKSLTKKSTFHIWFDATYCLELTTHEELNCVKNIFRDCCSIWLSIEYECEICCWVQRWEFRSLICQLRSRLFDVYLV